MYEERASTGQPSEGQITCNIAGVAKASSISKERELHNTKNLPELALSILALAFSIAFALTPPDFSRAEITWAPAAGDEGGVFQLTRGWPESLRASTTCEAIKTGKQGLILDAGGLKFHSSSESILFEVEDVAGQQTVNLPTGDCKVDLGFSSEKKIVYVSIDGLEHSIAVEQQFFPKITKLETPLDQPSILQDVKILTRPTGIHGLGLRGLWGSTALLAIGAALLVFLRRQKKSFERVSASMHRFHFSDAFVAVFVVGTAFLIPPAEDDGWILTIVDAYEGRNVFGNYYWANDALSPQGSLNMLAFHLLRILGFEVVHLRLFVALIVIATWLVLRRGVLQPSVGQSNWVIIPSAGLFLSFAGSYLMTLRPEPFVTLFVAITFATLLKYQNSASSIALGVGTLSAGIAFSLHQSGMVALVPWLAMAVLAWKKLKTSTGLTTNSQLASLGLGFAGSCLVLFLPFELKTLIDNLAEYSLLQSHSNGIFGEISRYRNLLNVAGPFFFPVAALMLFIAFGSFRFSNMNSEQRKLWAVALLSMAGLFISGSKWVWHFGVYAVPGTILLALVIAQATKSHPVLGTQRQFSILLPALLFLVGVVFEQFGTWGALAWHSPIWQVFEALIRPSNAFILWVTAIALLAVLGYQLDNRFAESRSRLTAGILLASLLMFPILTTMAFLLVESTIPGKWTAAQQNRSSLFGDDECGALGSSTFVESAKPLPILDSSTESASSLTPSGHPSLEGVSQGPLVGVPTWGTWSSPMERTVVPDVESPNDHRFGKFVTPKFNLANQDHIGIWSTTGGGAHQNSEVIFLGENDEVISSTTLKNSTYSAPFDRVWHLNRLQIPELAVSTYVEIQDHSTAEGGWAAVSSPSELGEISARELLVGKSSFTGPFERTTYPCLELKPPLDGFWNQVEFVTPNASTWEARKYVGLTLTQIGCAAESPACIFRVQYPQAQVSVTSSR
jgi:hypothetical protein